MSVKSRLVKALWFTTRSRQPVWEVYGSCTNPLAVEKIRARARTQPWQPVGNT